MRASINTARDAILRRFNKPLWFLVYRLTGRRMAVDVAMGDVGQIIAGFDVPSAAVRPWLPSPRLVLAEHAPGLARIIIQGNEFREVALARRPYAEVALSVPVGFHPPDGRPPVSGSFYLYLLSTAHEAVWSAVEIYGYPKEGGVVSFAAEAGWRSCRAASNGCHLLELAVNLPPVSHQTAAVEAFTVLDGCLRRVPWSAAGQMGTVEEPGGAHCTLGDHPWAVRLREAGMSTTSRWHTYVARQRGTLFKPAERWELS